MQALTGNFGSFAGSSPRRKHRLHDSRGTSAGRRRHPPSSHPGSWRSRRRTGCWPRHRPRWNGRTPRWTSGTCSRNRWPLSADDGSWSWHGRCCSATDARTSPRTPWWSRRTRRLWTRRSWRLRWPAGRIHGWTPLLNRHLGFFVSVCVPGNLPFLNQDAFLSTSPHFRVEK